MIFYWIILLALYFYYFISLVAHLFNLLIELLSTLFYNIYSVLYIDCYIFTIIIFLFHFLIIVCCIWPPVEYLFVPIINNICHFIQEIKETESFSILCFYILFTLPILDNLITFIIYSIQSINHSLYIYFFLLIIPIAQYDLITDDFSINNILIINNIPTSKNYPLHPRTCIDPAKSHWPLGSLVEYAYIDFNLLNEKIKSNSLKLNGLVPTSILDSVNLTAWRRESCLNFITKIGYDNSYIYFKTKDQRVDYGLLYNKPFTTQNELEAMWAPYLSPESPTERTLSSFMIREPSTALPESSLSSIINDSKLSKLAPDLNLFSTLENNDVNKPFLKKSSPLLSSSLNTSSNLSLCPSCFKPFTCSSSVSSSCICPSIPFSNPPIRPFSSFLNTLDEKAFIESRHNITSSPLNSACSRSELPTSICQYCSQSLNSCICYITQSHLNENYSLLSMACSSVPVPSVSPNTIEELNSVCLSNNVPSLEPELSSIFTSSSNSLLLPPINTFSSNLVNDSDPLNLFNFTFDDL